MTLREDSPGLDAEFGALLAGSAEEAGAPGAQLAVLKDGVLINSTFGLADVQQALSVTSDTHFRAGSTMKLMTACLIARLVDQGRLSFDATVGSYLPSFCVADGSASRVITLRHLLSHTSGFDGDFFVDFGSLPEAIARYVDACADLPQLFTPGHFHSYNNAGFAILARVAEAVAAKPWAQLMKEEVFAPLGMSNTHLDDAGLRHALGYVAGDDADLQPAEESYPAALAPAGAGPLTTATDLAKLGSVLANGGLSSEAARFLSEAAVSAMTAREVEGPAATFASAWGLGAMLFDYQGGRTVVGHDGVVPGQSAFLRADPKTGLVVALIANGGDMRHLAHSVLTGVFSRYTDTKPSQPGFTALANGQDMRPCVGRYQARAATVTVTAEGNHLVITARPTAEGAVGVPTFSAEAYPTEQPGLVAMMMDGQREPLLQRFVFDGTDSQAKAFVFRGRHYPRVGE
ncbi:MAG: serine hydrolase domain-containing protein [Pseudomonadota bacterium]